MHPKKEFFHFIYLSFYKGIESLNQLCYNAPAYDYF